MKNTSNLDQLLTKTVLSKRPNRRQDRRINEAESEQQRHQKFLQEYRGLRTNYPYSRYDCARLFYVKPQTGESIFNIHQADEIIENRLRSLMNFGYYVDRTKQKLYLPQKDQRVKMKPWEKSIMTMRRKVKLSFYCFNCKKKFTSIVGLFEIKFKIQINNQKAAKVEFIPKIYYQQCQTCHKRCQGKIYECQLRAAFKTFYLLIAQIIEQILPPKHFDKRNKQNQEMHDHKEELCQACQKGVCFSRNKDQTKIEESKKQTQD